MVIDQGEQDGFQIPAGLGWATGTLSTSGGLPNTEQFAAFPQRFVMDSFYKLNSVALPGRVMALWQGGIKSTAGTFTGTIALDASNSGILTGNASVSGVVFRRNDLETVGAGLIKIPTTGVKGSFRTGAFLMDR
jgi:hypothetical protein